MTQDALYVGPDKDKKSIDIGAAEPLPGGEVGYFDKITNEAPHLMPSPEERPLGRIPKMGFSARGPRVHAASRPCTLAAGTGAAALAIPEDGAELAIIPGGRGGPLCFAAGNMHRYPARCSTNISLVEG